MRQRVVFGKRKFWSEFLPTYDDLGPQFLIYKVGLEITHGVIGMIKHSNVCESAFYTIKC